MLHGVQAGDSCYRLRCLVNRLHSFFIHPATVHFDSSNRLREADFSSLILIATWSSSGLQAFGQNELAPEFDRFKLSLCNQQIHSFSDPATIRIDSLDFQSGRTIKKGDSFRIAVIPEASVMGDFMSPKRFPNTRSAPS